MIKRWGDTDDDTMSGLILAGHEVSHAELQEWPTTRLRAIEVGVPAAIVAEYEAGGGTFAPGDLHAWLLQRAEPEDEPWTIIHQYTRQQAIVEGQLVDVSKEAKETGFKIPLAISRTVWAQYVEVPKGVQCQDERGRLHDILFCLHVAIKREAMDTDTVFFKLHVRNSNRAGTPPLVTLRAVCGPSDDGSPCITIMTMSED